MQIKNRQQFLTVLTIAAVALLAIDKIVSPPLVKLWKSRAARINQLRNDVLNGESLRKSKDAYRRTWAQMQAGTLTNNTTIAEQQLFTGLNHWSQLSGITINTVTPQWKQGSDPTYKTIECRVDAAGSIDRVSEFLYNLEKDPMALKLQSIELSSRDNTGMQLALGVQISGLVLTPSEKAR